MLGEPKEPMEIGVDKPREGLYLREDVDVKCNVVFSSFVRRNLKKNHAILVQRLLKRVGSLQKSSLQLDRPSTFRSSSSDPMLSSRGSNSIDILSPAYTNSESPLSPGPPRRIGTQCICTWTSGGGQKHLIACPYYSRLYLPPKLVTPSQTSSSTTPYTAPVDGPLPWDAAQTSNYPVAHAPSPLVGHYPGDRPVSAISALEGQNPDNLWLQDDPVSAVYPQGISAVGGAPPGNHEVHKSTPEHFAQDIETNPESARQYYEYQARRAEVE